MNKNLLLLLVAGFLATNCFSQILWSDDFESYELGNFTDQGGWFIETENEEWVNIVSLHSSPDQSIQINSTEENTSGLFVTHYNDWAERDDENNIIIVDFDLYTGLPLEGVGMVVIGTDDFDIIIEVGWFFIEGEENNLYIASSSDEGILLDNPEYGIWYHVTISYNSITGEIKGRIDDEPIVELLGEPEMEPNVFDFTSLLESQMSLDNIIVRASNVDFIGIAKHQAHSATIFPNPTSDIINLNSNKTIDKLLIYDTCGKLLKSACSQKQLNIQDLVEGIYLLRIKYDDGTYETQKIVKK